MISLQIAVLLLLGGGGGGMLGIPPEAEDPLMAKVAPADCWFYMTWSGSAQPSSSSSNSVERLLSEPQVKQFQAVLAAQFDELIKTAAGQTGDPQAQAMVAELSKLLAKLRHHSAAIFLADLKFGPSGPNGPPQVAGGILVNLGGEVASVKTSLEKFQNDFATGKFTKKEIENVPFYRIELAPTAPVITWGTRGKYLIIGLGEGSAEEILTRAKGTAPSWLTDVRKRLSVPRVSTFSYVNVPKIVAFAQLATQDPKFATGIKAFGADKIGAIASISGLDETSYVSRCWVPVNGQPTGLLAWLNMKPLTSADLSVIPATAPVGIAFKLDLALIVEAWLAMASQVDPKAAADMQTGLANSEKQIGINLRQDIFQSLGDTWRIYADAQGGGLIGGWTIRVSVRDGQKLGSAYQKLMGMANNALGGQPGQPARPGMPTLKTSQVAGQTVYSLGLPQPGIPVAPSWCLTNSDLYISANFKPIQNALGSKEGKSLADVPHVASIFSGNSAPLACAVLDMKQIIRTLYPLLQVAQNAAAQAGAKIPFDVSKLPPVDVVEKHLQPSVYVLNRMTDGIEFSSRETLVGAGPTTAVPVAIALLLPAVSVARQAAQRTSVGNNLKQVGLAMHNFADTYKAFPAAHNMDSSGKPLLSWRVHILPFVEQGPLYKEFHLNEPWDSEHNKKLVERMPSIYAPVGGVDIGKGKTVILGVKGKDGIFVAPKDSNAPLGTSLAQITDGTSNTIMVVEASPQAAVVWTKPDDFEASEIDPLRGLLPGLRPGGFQVLTSDGAVKLLSEKIDRTVLKALFTKSGGEMVQAP